MSYIEFFELSHSGIKGMKWHNRRYQNEDGTLTEEGKLRYRKSEKAESKEEQTTKKNSSTTDEKTNNGKKTENKKQKKDKYTLTSEVLDNSSKILNDSAKLMKTGNGTYVKKNYSKLSNEELQSRIKRLELEKKYGDLSGDTKYIQSGSEKVKDILQTVGAIVGIAGTSVIVAQGVMDIYKNSSKKPRNSGGIQHER